MANNGQTRRKSSLTIYERLSPNCTSPRNKKIRRLTPHCVAGNLSVESTLGLSRFVRHDAVNGASCNYAIGSDGRIGLGVAEVNRSWCSSSRVNDHEAITYEIANNGTGPDWRMSDAAINAWINLAVETALFYGFKKVNYQPKPDSIAPAGVEAWIATWARPDDMIITLHCWFANKACPGPYFMRQLPWIVREMNKRLNGMAAEAFVGEGAASPGPQPVADIFKDYQIRVTAASLNIRKGPGTNNAVVRVLSNDKNIYTIVGEADGPGAKKWGRLKSGIGWISLDFTSKV